MREGKAMKMDERRRRAAHVSGARERSGMTQAALAAAAGISERALQYVESVERDPQTDTLRKLQAALGVVYDSDGPLDLNTIDEPVRAVLTMVAVILLARKGDARLAMIGRLTRTLVEDSHTS